MLLPCIVQAEPAVAVKWYRNGIPVAASGDTHAVMTNNSIHLQQLDWRDNGVFQCAAENEAGLFFINIELKVQSMLKFLFFYYY